MFLRITRGKLSTAWNYKMIDINFVEYFSVRIDAEAWDQDGGQRKQISTFVVVIGEVVVMDQCSLTSNFEAQLGFVNIQENYFNFVSYRII